MVRRTFAMSIALVFASLTYAQADEMEGESIPVPPPVVQQETVMVEEAVTAPPPPFVELTSRSIGAGIGLSWGEGVLSFEGERHAFSVKGLSVGDLGIAKLISEGAVANLENLADFEGHYVAVEAGAAAGVGTSVFSMRNEKGVVIHLKSDVAGVQLALGAHGFQISLD